jgi:hypothetical protein
MAPGFFQKIGDAFKKTYTFVKDKVVKPVIQKVIKPVYQKVVKPVWEVAKPFVKTTLQGVAATKGIDPNLVGGLVDAGDGLADSILGEKRPPPPPEPDSTPIVQYVDEEGNPVDEQGRPLSALEVMRRNT